MPPSWREGPALEERHPGHDHDDDDLDHDDHGDGDNDGDDDGDDDDHDDHDHDDHDHDNHDHDDHDHDNDYLNAYLCEDQLTKMTRNLLMIEFMMGVFVPSWLVVEPTMR